METLRFLFYEHRKKLIVTCIVGALLVLLLSLYFFLTGGTNETTTKIDVTSTELPDIIQEDLAAHPFESGLYVVGYMVDNILHTKDDLGDIYTYVLIKVLSPALQPMQSYQAEYERVQAQEFFDQEYLVHEYETWQPTAYKVRITKDGKTFLTKY